jgi:NADH:ubiquinone oxidoreductase subunit C
VTTTSAPPPAPPAAPVDPVEQALSLRFPDALASPLSRDHPTRLVPVDEWIESATALRDELGFTRFLDLTCVDEPARADRFELHLLAYSMEQRRWARLKTRVEESAPSLIGVYPAVNMYEREVFDMYGVRFDGHPNLTRILMPDAWPTHPLRRDEPLVTEPIDFTVTRELYKT